VVIRQACVILGAAGLALLRIGVGSRVLRWRRLLTRGRAVMRLMNNVGRPGRL
jgi:hypothetical protein